MDVIIVAWHGLIGLGIEDIEDVDKDEDMAGTAMGSETGQCLCLIV